ncbi:hypothetical protein HHK36_022969 [Tetracentron sinense]|uniref:CTP synthase n=1 Tax=Tetracentron sinense TaxID=13715 RepID=A0A834YSV6_TETSI|nr:hypothetical protein HHK36_022969 [Tetracentron sinense]
MKYVLVSGGVVSGLGKGVTASSIGVVLKACGLRVTSIKIDPYLNTDAGTMSPFEHGEVFVLDDGGEVDLDLGNYERFLDVTLTRDNNITTGKIYQSVLDKERRGEFLGKTVQVVPHITDAIRNWIESVSSVPVDGKEGSPDVCVIELGGTVGDIESMPFIEALRQLSFSVGKAVLCFLSFIESAGKLVLILDAVQWNPEAPPRTLPRVRLLCGQDNFCLVHVSLIPVLGVVGEQKTKPTQHSVRELRALGLTPHLLACRSAQAGNILNIHDVPNIWHVPLLLRSPPSSQPRFRVRRDKGKFNIGLYGSNGTKASSEFRVGLTWTDLKVLCYLTDYESSVSALLLLLIYKSGVRGQRLMIISPIQLVRIAMVGKYIGLTDSYLSVVKALLHACIACSLKPSVDWIAASDLEDDSAKLTPEAHAAAWETLRGAACVLVPGGFGDRGVQGMILAAKYARENRIPYLGICLGMQISVLGLERANSTEFDAETPDPVVFFMPEGSRTHMGSTMRLGSRRTLFQTPDCITSKLYHNSEYVDERHRHRYEVNPEVIVKLEEADLKFVGKDESGRRMEILELPTHPFYVGVQFHPEFKSRPGRPSALFLGLILAATGQLESYLNKHQNGS